MRFRVPGSAPLTAWPVPCACRWPLFGRGLTALALAVVLAPVPCAAEEIAALGGWTDTDDPSSASYAWGLQYRQRLSTHLDAGFGYLNEGHLLGHHRDGAMLQLWARTSAWHDRLDLAFGAGPYAYFDTQNSSDEEGYDDDHGVGLILSAAVNYSLSSNWFAVLQLNKVVAPGSVGTRSLLIGVGYRLEQFLERLDQSPGGDPAAAVSDAANELDAFLGTTVVNTLTSERSTNFGVEYRRRTARHVELSTSLINEGDGADGRHWGVTGEGWLVQEFASRQLILGLGVGPFVSFEGYHTADGRTAASVVGLASMTASWRVARTLALRLSWHRGFTGDDQDRDIVTAAVAWRF